MVNDDDISKPDESPLSNLKNEFEFSGDTKPRRRKSPQAHKLHTPQSPPKQVENIGGTLDFLDKSEGGQEDKENSES